MWFALFDRVLNGFFKVGELTVHYPDGGVCHYGDGATPQVVVHLKDRNIMRDALLNVDLAIGNGFTNGTFVIENEDLDAFFALVLKNRISADGSNLFSVLRRLRYHRDRFMLRNPIGRAQENVAHHYDLSGQLYDLFLDEDRQYSCAYFERPDMSLEEAQIAKKHHVARKLCLSPGQRVLDIGCGWGGLAITLAKDHGVLVTGVTLSKEQHALANKRVAKAGLSDRVEIKLLDYRLIEDQFDRVVSVGMFEHVGPLNYGEYFNKVDKLLADDGVALIHTIGWGDTPTNTSAWIRQNIFPGGHIPSLSEFLKAIEGSELRISDLEVLRLHYAETLLHWHDRFMKNRDKAAQIYDESFVRMWRYYLKASEMTFRHSWQVVFQLQLSKNIDIIPITRTYLYQ